MQRLCFLCLNADSARKAVRALRQAGADESNLMVVARSDIPLENLPVAGIEKTDATAGLLRGLAAGGVIGTIAGIVVIAFEDVGLALGGGAIALFALFGASVSGLASLLGGASLSNSRLHRFEKAIDRDGKILLMVDGGAEQVQRFRDAIEQADPTVEYAGEEPPIPIIPS